MDTARICYQGSGEVWHSCCFFACFLVALGAVFLANLEHGEDELLWKNRCKYTFSPVFGSWMAEALRSNFT